MKHKYVEGIVTELVATEATDLLTANGQEPEDTAKGFDVAGYTVVGFQIKNTGDTNALTTLAVYWTEDPAGVVWPATPDATVAFPSPGTVAFGAVSVPFRVPVRGRRMRIVVTSASGSTCALYLFANDEQQLNATEINGAVVSATISGAVTITSGSVTVSAATIAALTDGTQKAQVSSGAKGSSAAALVTSTAMGANHQGLDVVPASPNLIAQVTLSDSTTYTDVKGFVCTTGGLLYVDAAGGGSNIPWPVIAGVPYFLEVTKFYTTGTTATGVILFK